MICYFPFTYMDPKPLHWIAQSLGPITLYYPMAVLVPEPLYPMQQQGLLDVRAPVGVDESRLMAALQDFKHWAELHDGQLDDMIQYHFAHQGRPPMMDESAPSQISTQIRHFHDDPEEGAGPLLQAALYLNLAHEYDQYQDGLHQDLGAVKIRERAMYAALGPDAEDVGTGETKWSRTGESPHAADPGAYMTHQRLEAWARLVASVPQPPRVYVTPSKTVFEHVKGLGIDIVELPRWHLSMTRDHLALKEQRRQSLTEASHTTDLQNLMGDPDLCGDARGDTVDLQWICFPEDMIDTLLARPLKRPLPSHTLIGLVETLQSHH